MSKTNGGKDCSGGDLQGNPGMDLDFPRIGFSPPFLCFRRFFFLGGGCCDIRYVMEAGHFAHCWSGNLIVVMQS